MSRCKINININLWLYIKLYLESHLLSTFSAAVSQSWSEFGELRCRRKLTFLNCTSCDEKSEIASPHNIAVSSSLQMHLNVDGWKRLIQVTSLKLYLRNLIYFSSGGWSLVGRCHWLCLNSGAASSWVRICFVAYVTVQCRALSQFKGIMSCRVRLIVRKT